MPDMDGLAVLRTLKGSPATARIPVLVMSGTPDLKPTMRAQVLALGAADLIAKPYDLGMLVAEIKLFLAAYP
jgi:CheY-like chemotaxis protein